MNAYYDAIVIGSGLGGLTAGALFSQAGYRVLVLERNDSFGGAATTYHRGQLTIEASLHETTDPRTTPDPKGEIFAALDLYDDVEFVPVTDFYQVRSSLIGEPLTIPHGFDALSERLVERFPGDADAIRGFLHQVNLVQNAMLFMMEKHNGAWWLIHGAELPFRLWLVLRDMRSSLSDVLQRFFGDNEGIKIALAANLCYYSDDPDQLWWLAYALAQGGYVHGGGNYFKGGSQTLSDQLVSRIREAEGEVLAGQTAVEILLDDEGAIKGVRYEPRTGGASVTALSSVVFANASPLVIENMLPDVQRPAFMEPYRDEALSISLFSVTLGLDQLPSGLGVDAYSTVLVPDWMQRLSDFKHCAALLAENPVGKLPTIVVVDYNQIDSGLTDGGLYPVNVVGVDSLSNWEGLGQDAYRKKSNAWLDAVIARLDQEWPGLARAVEQRAISTARSMHEHLNAPGGALYGFAPRVPDHLLFSGPPRTPSTSIRGLWLASAYAHGGGFTGAMSGGGAAAKAALREFH